MTSETGGCWELLIIEMQNIWYTVHGGFKFGSFRVSRVVLHRGGADDERLDHDEVPQFVWDEVKKAVPRDCPVNAINDEHEVVEVVMLDE